MSLPVGLPAHVKITAVRLSGVYTSAVTMNVPVQNTYSSYKKCIWWTPRGIRCTKRPWTRSV